MKNSIIEPGDIGGYIVTYIHLNELKSKIIRPELKDKFDVEFGDVGIDITLKQIEDFIESNKL